MRFSFRVLAGKAALIRETAPRCRNAVMLKVISRKTKKRHSRNSPQMALCNAVKLCALVSNGSDTLCCYFNTFGASRQLFLSKFLSKSFCFITRSCVNKKQDSRSGIHHATVSKEWQYAVQRLPIMHLSLNLSPRTDYTSLTSDCQYSVDYFQPKSIFLFNSAIIQFGFNYLNRRIWFLL